MAKRTWVVHCKVCQRWSPVPTLEVQTRCREVGACLECLASDWFPLKLRIVALESNMAAVAARGKQLPEDRRVYLRKVYTKMAKKLEAARAQLHELDQSEVAS